MILINDIIEYIISVPDELIKNILRFYLILLAFYTGRSIEKLLGRLTNLEDRFNRVASGVFAFGFYILLNLSLIIVVIWFKENFFSIFLKKQLFSIILYYFGWLLIIVSPVFLSQFITFLISLKELNSKLAQKPEKKTIKIIVDKTRYTATLDKQEELKSTSINSSHRLTISDILNQFKLIFKFEEKPLSKLDEGSFIKIFAYTLVFIFYFVVLVVYFCFLKLNSIVSLNLYYFQ